MKTRVSLKYFVNVCKLKKIKKALLKKSPLYFRKWNFLTKKLKDFLYFLKRKLLLYFRNGTLHFLNLGLKSRDKSPLKKVLIFSIHGTLWL